MSRFLKYVLQARGVKKLHWAFEAAGDLTFGCDLKLHRAFNFPGPEPKGPGLGIIFECGEPEPGPSPSRAPPT